MLRALLGCLCLADLYDYDDAIASALSLEDDDAALGDADELERRIQTLPDTELGNRICLYIAVKQAGNIEEWANNTRVIAPAPALLSLATSVGIDAQGIQAEVQDEMRAELEPPAARAGGNSAAKPKKAKATKPAKPSKMSAEQAQQGIAAAMQDIEAASSGAADGEVDEEIDEGAEA